MTLNEAAAFLRQGDRYLILTHRRPDGDTVGSAAALCRLLRACGKQAHLYPNEDLTPKFAFLYEGLLAPEGYEAALLVAADIATEDLLPQSAQWCRGKIDLCIDHHGSNGLFARQTLVDPGRSAVGELIWELGELLGVPPSIPFCDGVYTAIATDTGCFRYPNTTARAHEVAGRCMESGADFGRINKVFFETKSPARFRVEQYLFEHLAFSADGAVAAALFPRQAIDTLGATSDDLDNLAALPRQIEGVECSIILTYTKDGGYKASVRTGERVNASDLCGQFGGGGHARAAGCTLQGDGPACLRRLVAAAQGALGYV